jgi:ribosomal protein S18 acetylase RimI-like enzyme
MNLPPGPEAEICGIVHPHFRRQGIGRTMLAAAREEYRRRGERSLLLVCEETSCSGRAFVEAVGVQYRFSEYRMQLDPSAIGSHPRPGPVQLSPAGAQDAELLSRLTAASFDDPIDEVRPRITGWLRQDDQHFYIGRRQEEPIGSLRVHRIQEASCVYVNTFGVLPHYRGRGYGRRILGALIDTLLAEGWKQIMIEVQTDNRPALSVYRACGFREIRTYRYSELELSPSSSPGAA